MRNDKIDPFVIVFILQYEKKIFYSFIFLAFKTCKAIEHWNFPFVRKLDSLTPSEFLKKQMASRRKI